MSNEELDEAIRQCTHAQQLIEINAELLNQFRTECSISEEDTLDMIRKKESKLIRFFAEQLVVKHKWPSSEKLAAYPSLRLWLNIVGLSESSIEAINTHVETVENLLAKYDDSELSKILTAVKATADEKRRLTDASKNLNLYLKYLLNTESNGKACSTSDETIDCTTIDIHNLHWDSWDVSNKLTESTSVSGLSDHSQSSTSQKIIVSSNRDCIDVTTACTSSNEATRKSSPLSPPQSASSRTCPWSPIFHSDETNPFTETCNSRSGHVKQQSKQTQGQQQQTQSQQITSQQQQQQHSPPETPSSAPGIHDSSNSLNNNKRTSVNCSLRPSTPPAARRHQTKLLSEPFPLTKSRSHEENLSNRIDTLSSNSRVHELISSSISPATNIVTSSNSFNLIPQNNCSSSLSSPHAHRRRLATEPSNIGCSTSPIISPCRSPPPVSPDQSDSCFDDASNSNTTPIPPSISSSSLTAGSRQTHHASSSVTSSTSIGSYHSSSNNLKYNNPSLINNGAISNINCTSNCNYNSQTSVSGQQPSAPRSPRTHGGMTHVIHHRFVTYYKITSFACSLCDKPMYIGLRCKECKYVCHKDCQDKVPPSCGLPTGFLQVFRQTLQDNQASSIASSTSTEIMSPSSVKSEYRGTGRHHHRRQHPSGTSSNLNGTCTSASGSNSLSSSKPTINITPLFGNVDSSSNTSSCTSSTPSSPALLGSNSNAATPSSASHGRTFHFPDVSNGCTGNHSNASPASLTSSCNDTRSSTSGFISNDNRSKGSTSNKLTVSDSSNTLHTLNDRDVIDTHKSNDSEKTMSIASGSTDSERTIAGRIDSQDSTVSELDNDRNWPRQNSLTSKEWEIPYDELQIEEAIGTGRLGTVFRGSWHGAVAIKRLNMEPGIDDKKYLEAFRQEVATFRKTRHDNLVLFMGACMKPPHLAIVTSLCKGMTLYTHLHIKKNKIQPSQALVIAQQICQGMSYLHARDIIHKDLKTKNVFYESGKVVITDFGLFSVTKICQGNRRGDWLTVPKGWLCYLAPEIMRSLKPCDQKNDNLPFSAASDVFAFGTVWYELLYGEWPFKGQPPEVILWQVGRGAKPSLNNLQASKDVKDLLMICWDFQALRRPEFSKLLETLSKLPKKRLQRSPSHPVQLLRSAESAF